MNIPTKENRSLENTMDKQQKKLGRNFHKLLGGVSLTMIGDGLTLISIPWIATTLTDQSFLISMVSAAMVLPWLLFSLPVGVLIDRISHQRLMVFSSLFRFMILALLVLLIFYEWIHITLLVVFTFFIGVAKVIFDSTAQTTVPKVVGKQQLEKANGYMVTSISTMDDIVGKGLGGILLSFGLFVPLLIDAMTALLTIPILLTISGAFREGRTETSQSTVKQNFFQELKSGIKWVWENRLIRNLAMISILVTTMFSSLVSIQVLFIQEILGLGSSGFGLLMAIAAIGAILGGQLSGWLKHLLGTNKGMLLSLLIIGISLGLVGIISRHWSVVAILFIIGNFSVVIWNVFRLSFLQRITSEDKIGRVLSIFRFVSWGMSPLGMLLGGAIVTIGEYYVGRDLALRLPYINLMIVYCICFVMLARLLKTKERYGR